MLLAWLAQPPAEVTLSWPVLAGGVAAVLTSAALLAGFAGWAYRRLRCWVIRTAHAAEQSAQTVSRAASTLSQELATSNGHTIGQYVEATAKQVGEVKEEITILTGWAGENRDLAQLALAVARQASASAERAHGRIEQHVMTGHGGQ